MNDEVIIRVCCYTFGKSKVCPSVWNVPLLWLAHTPAMYIPAWEHLLLLFLLPEMFFPKYLNGSLLHPLQSSIQVSPPQWTFLDHTVKICSHPELYFPFCFILFHSTYYNLTSYIFYLFVYWPFSPIRILSLWSEGFSSVLFIILSPMSGT